MAVTIDTSYDLVEWRDVLFDIISYGSLDLPKEDKKSCCVIFQQSVDYEKKLLSSTMLKFKAKVWEGNVRELVEKRIHFTLLEWLDGQGSILKN